MVNVHAVSANFLCCIVLCIACCYLLEIVYDTRNCCEVIEVQGAAISRISDIIYGEVRGRPEGGKNLEWGILRGSGFKHPRFNKVLG